MFPGKTPPGELADLNPYNALPTLVDRDLVLYEPNIMMEYLDERFPHPPLLPVYPVARANSRLMIHRIQKDWCGLVDQILAQPNAKASDAARKELRESLLATAPLFGEMPFFSCRKSSRSWIAVLLRFCGACRRWVLS